jgi:uncharacterized protein (TIGR02266 family)
MPSAPEQAEAAQTLATALTAGREARSVLGPLVSALDLPASALGASLAEQTRVAERLARVVGELYGLEVSDAQAAHDALERTLAGLDALLETTRARGQEPGLATTLARSLARLHPPTAALGRAIGRQPEDEVVVPLLLSRKRKPKVAPEPEAEALPLERRVEYRRSLEVDIGFASETNFYSGFSGDVSDGGLFVATWTLLPVGTELLLSFVLPGGRQVSAKGRVQWTRECRDDENVTPGMGVSFDEDMNDADLEAVRAFVARREPIFHP